jgi:hypothetical protein
MSKLRNRDGAGLDADSTELPTLAFNENLFDAAVDPCFSLREEARKSSQHITTDKLVYREHVIGCESYPLFVATKLQFYRRIWIEVHVRLRGQWNCDCVAIIDLPDLGLSSERELQEFASYRTEYRDSSMLVDIPKVIESPEVRETVGVSTAVWLKIANDGDGIGRDVLGCAANVPLSSAVSVIDPADGKARIVEGLAGCEKSQVPREMVEGGPQARDEIADEQPDIVGKFGGDIDLNYVFSVFRIILRRDSIGITLLECGNLRAESVKMYLRPSKFQIWIGHS